MNKIYTLALLIILLALAVPGKPAAAAAKAAMPEVGQITAIALDGKGNGWAAASGVASSGPTDYGAKFILRLENGAWRIWTDPAAIMPPPGVFVTSIALSASGATGWAAGQSPDSKGKPSALLWHLENGGWVGAAGDLPIYNLDYHITGLYDLSLSADGSEGWLLGTTDKADGSFALFHLSKGAWSLVAMPADESLFDMAISPDGKSGWGWGLSPKVETSNSAFQLQNGKWTPVDGEVFPPTHTSFAISANNAGSGWILSAHFREGLAPSVLTLLKPGAAPQQVTPTPDVKGMDDLSVQVLSTMTVDNNGRGFALGWVDVPSSGADRQNIPVAYTISGDTITYAPYTAFGLTAQQITSANYLVTTPDGAHTWIAWQDEKGYGQISEVRQFWPHDAPAATAPLQGSGQCFAAVSYCLRGVFATYWNKQGGLAQLGYPITPEVQEKIGDKTYTVQYTQRARLEWHPEFAGTANEVLLGLLGNTLVQSRLSADPFKATTAQTCSGCVFFKETGHNITAPVVSYWQKNGGVPVFGLPRSEAFNEKSGADGKTYKVQYFERNRIEYHPENKGTPYEFLLGLLGAEQFKQTYGYTP